MIMQKDIRLEGITCLKILSRIIMSSPMERSFMTIYLFGYKKIEKMRKLITGQVRGYTTECLLDYVQFG